MHVRAQVNLNCHEIVDFPPPPTPFLTCFSSFFFKIINRPFGCVICSFNPTMFAIDNHTSCPTIFDNLCWPETLANQSVSISCSNLAMQGVDATSLFSSRRENVLVDNCFFSLRIYHAKMFTHWKLVDGLI